MRRCGRHKIVCRFRSLDGEVTTLVLSHWEVFLRMIPNL